MFRADYMLTTGLAGAPVAHLDLYVDAPKKKINGNVTITQAVHPPLALKTDVHGSYIERDGLVAIHLLAEPPAPGGLEFGSTIVTRKWGDDGEGWFWYVNGETRYEAGPVPARKEVHAESVKK